jgi:hypothetical protein
VDQGRAGEPEHRRDRVGAEIDAGTEAHRGQGRCRFLFPADALPGAIEDR